jgi:hypothetical protein
MAGIGAAGLLALRRQLGLALFGWTVFVIAFVLNASTTWHLAESYVLTVWLGLVVAAVALVWVARQLPSTRRATIATVS